MGGVRGAESCSRTPFRSAPRGEIISVGAAEWPVRQVMRGSEEKPMVVDRRWDSIFRSGRTASYPKGQRVFLKGQPGGSVLRVVKGWVLVTEPNPDGTDTFLEIRGRGQLIGEASAFSGGVRNANVDAICKTVVQAVESGRFLADVERRDLMKDLLVHAQELHRQSNVRVGARGLGVRSSLSWLLLDLARTAGEPLISGIPQKTLAFALGVTPRTLSTAVSMLERRDAISVRWPAIRIRDERALRQLARCGED